MGHRITAVIGQLPVAAEVASAAGSPAPIALPFDLAIVALGDEQIDRLTGLAPGAYLAGFTYLSTGLQRALIQAAGDGMLAYIETDYAGGTGVQAASVLGAGAVVMQAATDIGIVRPGRDGPINEALRSLGIDTAARLDAFDMLGLRRFRTMASLGLADPEM